MKRLVFLYSPVVVVVAWVGVFNTLGRTDTSVTVGCVFLATTMFLHTYQIIEDFHRRNGQRHSERYQ